jgi:uncharacterized protein (TIGR02594 family)
MLATMKDEAPWLTMALLELAAGIRETPGPGETARINGYHAETAAGVPPGDGDETHWCSSGLCFCFHRAGLPSPRSKSARSWESYGVRLLRPRRAAIAVLERGPDPRHGHVGLVMHWTRDTWWLLGGNQGNRWSVAPYPRDRLVTLRWPPGVEIPEAA